MGWMIKCANNFMQKITWLLQIIAKKKLFVNDSYELSWHETCIHIFMLNKGG